MGKQEFVDGGSHTKEAVQDDAQYKKAQQGPEKGPVQEKRKEPGGQDGEGHVYHGEIGEAERVWPLFFHAQQVFVLT